MRRSGRIVGIAVAVALLAIAAVSIDGARIASTAGISESVAPHVSTPPPLDSPTPAPPIPVPTSTPAPAPAAVSPPPAQVLVIGDSIMKGYGLDASDAWPTLLADQEGWNLDSKACNGAGFIAVGANDCDETFPQIISATAGLTPAIILISGSSNDFGQDDAQLQAAITFSFNTLRTQFPTAQIIALSTVWGDTAPPAQLATINAQVSVAAQKVGASYLDIGQPLSGQPLLMQADDIHPTVAGQQVLEEAIFAALQQATIDRAEQYLTIALGR